jgi:hypothetical protein
MIKYIYTDSGRENKIALASLFEGRWERERKC